MPKARRKDPGGEWERENMRVMAAGKEEEANSQNEKEEEEKQAQKFLTALGEQQCKKGRFVHLN